MEGFFLLFWGGFFACGYLLVPAPLVEKAILSPLNDLHTFVKNQ